MDEGRGRSLVVVEVGDSQAAAKVGSNLLPGDGERRIDNLVRLGPQCDGALGLVPRRPRHHRVGVPAQQLLLLQHGVTCGGEATLVVFKKDLNRNIERKKENTCGVLTHVTVAFLFGELVEVCVH